MKSHFRGRRRIPVRPSPFFRVRKSLTFVALEVQLGTTLMSSSTSNNNKNKISYYADDRVLERFYQTLAEGNTRKMLRVHIPRSEVFYAREAYYQHSGEWVTLDRMERCMFLEGMLSASDVLDPRRKREWEKTPD